MSAWASILVRRQGPEPRTPLISKPHSAGAQLTRYRCTRTSSAHLTESYAQTADPAAAHLHSVAS